MCIHFLIPIHSPAYPGFLHNSEMFLIEMPKSCLRNVSLRRTVKEPPPPYFSAPTPINSATLPGGPIIRFSADPTRSRRIPQEGHGRCQLQV